MYVEKGVRAMKIGTIIVGSPKYEGCYIARPSFRSTKIVAHGSDAGQVRREAVEKGYKSPVVVFNTPKDAICLY